MAIKERRREVAPAEFGQEFLGVALEGGSRGGRALDSGGDAARRNFAEAQVGREP